MSFTATPVDGSASPVPMSSVVPDGTNTPIALEGGPSLSSGGNTLAPASMYVKDGNDLTQGSTTDVAVVGDNPGSVSAKLRGLNKILNSVWDSINNLLHFNLKQVGGSAVVTGTGASGAGIPRVTVSNDSTVQPGNTQNTTPWLVQETGADVVVLASAARTTTQTSVDQTNNGGCGIRIIVDVTSAGTGSITMTINGKDTASGKYILILAGAAITTVSTNEYIVYPTITAAANSIAQRALVHTFQIVVTANNANSVTYSVGYSILL